MRYILISIVLSLTYCGDLTASSQPLPHVKHYDVVRPQRLSRSRRSVSDKGTDGPGTQYPAEVHYDLHFNGKTHTIFLEKNRLLIGENYTETYYKENGSRKITSPDLNDHCYYHGHIQGIEDSSVSVGICDGIRGFIKAEDQVYLIEPLNNASDGDHALYRHEHLRMKRASCGNVNDTVFDNGPRVAGLFNPKGWKRRPASRSQRYVEMYLVVDNAEYVNYRKSLKEVRARMLEVANHVDKLYRPLNIRIMLVGLEVWTVTDQILVSLSPDDTLTRFNQWRQDTLVKRVKHDNAQFVTGIDFLGDTVGLATKFAMCTENSAAVNQDHNENAIGLASTIAHEMGHNMGMSHDDTYCSCPASTYSTNCIMSGRLGSVFPELFSDCSQEQLGVFLDNVNPSCILDTPSSDRLYGGPVCGNAFLDPGEECDCGTVEECKNPCCNALTCRLAEGSQCAQGECCENCQFKQAASLCRPTAGECDLPEYCTGLSEQCPKDVFKMNGLACSSGQGYCYNGQCPTHRQHCKRLWGPDAQEAPGICFNRNTLGERDSNCGKTVNTYKRCSGENVQCGTIFCIGGNEYPITGQKAIVRIGLAMCNIAGEHSGSEGLSMVPTGAKCGLNKVCYDHICQDVKVYGLDVDCSLKCNGRGVCNHLKECNCEPGWAPPYCDVKYTDLPQNKKTVIISVVTVSALLLLFILLVGGVIYYKKGKKHFLRGKVKVPLDTGRMNPLFEKHNSDDTHRTPVQISEPTFVDSSATQACTPLVARAAPVRPAPQPPMPPVQSSSVEMKPLPPTKPLPPLYVKQASKPGPPPLPPVKPAVVNASLNKQPAGGEGKLALRPPTIPRR